MDYEAARAEMIDYLSTKIDAPEVLSAMRQVPRERFVPPGERQLAYDDRPLPIGLGQTISQPYIVALMTSLIKLQGEEKVLEVGTGSGYQTAILAQLARLVITVERLPELVERARKILDELGYDNVRVRLAGQAIGWPLDAPYDAIMVTAGAPRVPEGLLSQLALGGRMVIPVGRRYEQELLRITRRLEGNMVENLGGCRFVSLIGDEAWDSD